MTSIRSDNRSETDKRHRRFSADLILSPRMIGLPVLIAAIAIAPAFIRTSYQYDIMILIGINAIIAIGLNLLMGYAGQISLGHAAFFGVGAYVSTILAQDFNWNGFLALVFATFIVALFSYLIARPILRLSGHYLAMATLGLGMIVYIVINTERAWTGGPDGRSVPPLSIAGLSPTTPLAWYWIVGALLILTFWIAVNLIDSPFGRALRSIKGSEIAAKTAGIDVPRLKSLVFVLSTSIAAFMGGIFAFYSGFISPSSADFTHSIVFATMVVLGGMASIVGSIIGAAIMTLLPQYLTHFAEYEWLVYGITLMLIVIFMPRGLVPTFADGIRRLMR